MRLKLSVTLVTHAVLTPIRDPSDLMPSRSIGAGIADRSHAAVKSGPAAPQSMQWTP